MSNIKTKRFQEELYRKHYRRIFGITLRIIGNRMDAEEAMHDAFMKIFDHLDELRGEKAFIAWSGNIAMHTAIDRVRRKKIIFEPIDNLSIADEEPDETPELTVDAIKTVMATLPDGYRIILALRLFESCKFSDIADMLHIKETTVRSQFARGREKLVQQLKNISHE
jgi:RNA polymerase sigma-70 factor (ECF subfamily)